MFTLLKSRYYTIGYKKRVCLIIFFTSLVLLLLVLQYLKVNLSDVRTVHRRFTGKSRSSGVWDRWVKNNNLVSIGDVYDSCDPTNEERLKIGKAVLGYDEDSERIMVTLACNITLAEDITQGFANIYLTYRGRILHNETYDVCNDLAENVEALKCPMKRGQTISILESKKFPSHFPKGYFVAVGSVRNQDNKCLVKVEAEFEI